MRLVLFLVFMLHGLIHVLGFVKAFNYAEINQLTQEVSKPTGLLWLLGAFLLIAAGTLFVIQRSTWWWIGLPAIIISQLLIFTSWHDAKLGTIVNLIILLPIIAAILEARPVSYANRYKAAAHDGLARYVEMPFVTEADLSHLPGPVQKYLRITGTVGKPRVHNFRAVFTGEFRNGFKNPWMVFRSEQFNFIDQPTRLFLMKAAMYGLPVEGFHLFRDNSATMQIKLASLLQVVDAKGPEMNQGETVTLFNDLCLLAPAALIDKQRIQWETMGPLAARAKFTHMGITITALLSFNEFGELTDFISDDRYYSTGGESFKSYPWSTPVRNYKEFSGRKVVGYGEAVWHTPTGQFIYGKFNLTAIEYNLKKLGV